MNCNRSTVTSEWLLRVRLWDPYDSLSKTLWHPSSSSQNQPSMLWITWNHERLHHEDRFRALQNIHTCCWQTTVSPGFKVLHRIVRLNTEHRDISFPKSHDLLSSPLSDINKKCWTRQQSRSWVLKSICDLLASFPHAISVHDAQRMSEFLVRSNQSSWASIVMRRDEEHREEKALQSVHAMNQHLSRLASIYAVSDIQRACVLFAVPDRRLQDSPDKLVKSSAL